MAKGFTSEWPAQPGQFGSWEWCCWGRIALPEAVSPNAIRTRIVDRIFENRASKTVVRQERSGRGLNLVPGVEPLLRRNARQRTQSLGHAC